MKLIHLFPLILTILNSTASHSEVIFSCRQPSPSQCSPNIHISIGLSKAPRGWRPRYQSPAKKNSKKIRDQKSQNEFPYFEGHPIYDSVPFVQDNQQHEQESVRLERERILKLKQEKDNKEKEEQIRKEREHLQYIATQQTKAEQILASMATNSPEPGSAQERSQDRKKTLQEIKAGDAHIEHKTYHIDTATVDLLHKSDISAEKFSTCTGHQFQQVLHKELTTIISVVASQEMQRTITKSNNQTIGETILCFADVGCSYNKQEEMVKAVTLIDWCWSGIELLEKIDQVTADIITCAGKGIAQGVINTATMIAKPIDTICNISAAVTQVAKLTAKIINELCVISYLQTIDPWEGVRRQQELLNRTFDVCIVIQDHAEKLGVYGCITQGAEIATEGFLQGKILLQLGRLYSNTIPKINTLAKKFKSNILPKREVLLATTEGIEVEMVAESIEFLKTEADQAKNVARVSGNVTTRIPEEIAQQIQLKLEQNKHLIQEFDEIVNELAKKVSTKRFGKIEDIVDSNLYLKLEKKSEEFYSLMRNDLVDIKLISKNTGIPEHIIEKIKKHLFLDRHILDYGEIGNFPADTNIMKAWERLMNNEFVHTDLLLLQHEYVESFAMNGMDYSWEYAHPLVNLKYNWYHAL